MKRLEEAQEYIKTHLVDRSSRPSFHLTGPVGWINDPNGFSVYKGKTHLFYQYHPYNLEWGPMHWGHAVSEDMVVWQDYPVTLAPDQEYDQGGCFSGSAIETEEGHLLFYTGVGPDASGVYLQQQCLAIGDGKDYKKIAENPIILGESLPEGFNRIDFRDPKVWYQDKTYYLIAGNLDQDGDGQVVLYTSEDARTWSYKSVLANNKDYQLGTMWECPDFFQLDQVYVLVFSPQNMSARGYDLHNGHNSVYVLGTFDQEKGKFEGEGALSLDYGLDFYAPQTSLASDGRRILIAWLKSWDNPIIPTGQQWHGMMTLPRELTVKDGRIYQQPIREIENYRKNKIFYKGQLEGTRTIQGIDGRELDMCLSLTDMDFEELSIDLAAESVYKTRITVNRKKGFIELDRTYAGLTKDLVTNRKMPLPAGEELDLRFIMDKSSIELFINQGWGVASMVLPTPLEASGIEFHCDGKVEIEIEKYDLVF